MTEKLLWVPGEPTFNPVSERKISGAAIINGNQVADTIQCKHCGMHWISLRGSKKRRGFCMKCMGPLCGKKSCMVCVPLMERLKYRGLKKKGKLHQQKEMEWKYPELKTL